MEKLIELLTEHCRKHYGFKDNDDIEIDTDSVCFHLYHKGKRCFPIRIETVICKDFGFIGWLVENDKIDYQKSPGEIMFDDRMGTTFCLEDSIIMMLSISSSPIEDLISYLK